MIGGAFVINCFCAWPGFVTASMYICIKVLETLNWDTADAGYG